MEVDEGVAALGGGTERKSVHGLEREVGGSQGARENGVVVARPRSGGSQAEPDFLARTGI